MTRIAGARFPSIANWLVLCLNVFLLAFLASRLLVILNGANATADSVAKHLGMNVYCARDPFMILVHDDFDQKGTFQLLSQQESPWLSVEEVDEENRDSELRSNPAVRVAALDLGIDAGLTCLYSYDKVKRRFTLHETTLTQDTDWFCDLNADGFYDIRFGLDQESKQHIGEIWYEGAWRVIAGDSAGRYQKELPDLGPVTFDMQSGRWLSTTDSRDTTNHKNSAPGGHELP